MNPNISTYDSWPIPRPLIGPRQHATSRPSIRQRTAPGRRPSKEEGVACRHPPAGHRPNRLLAADGQGSEQSTRRRLRARPWREGGEAVPPAHHREDETGAGPGPAASPRRAGGGRPAIVRCGAKGCAPAQPATIEAPPEAPAGRRSPPSSHFPARFKAQGSPAAPPSTSPALRPLPRRAEEDEPQEEPQRTRSCRIEFPAAQPYRHAALLAGPRKRAKVEEPPQKNRRVDLPVGQPH